MRKWTHAEIHTENIVRQNLARSQRAEAKQRELQASIARRGIMVPLIVRRSMQSFTCVDGHRRLEAAVSLGIAAVPCVVIDGDLNERDVLLVQMITACQREDLGPIDRANAIRRLMDGGDVSARDVARELDISDATVSRLLGLLELSEPLQREVSNGKIGLVAANKLLEIDDIAKRESAGTELAAGKLTRDELSRRVTATWSDSTESKQTRFSARMGRDAQVNVCASGLTVESVLQLLTELVHKLRKARARGISLATLAKSLRDEAKAAAQTAAVS